MNYSRRSLERLLIAVNQLENEREMKICARFNDVLAPDVVSQVQLLMAAGKPIDIAAKLRDYMWEHGEDRELAERAAVEIERLRARIAELTKEIAVTATWR